MSTIKKIVLVSHSLLYIFIEFVQYGLTNIPSVPNQYVDMYKTFSLISLLIVIITQVSIVIYYKGDFWETILLQMLTNLVLFNMDLLINQYIDNQVTSYPVWSAFYWIIMLEIGLLFLIIFLLIRKGVKSS